MGFTCILAKKKYHSRWPLLGLLLRCKLGDFIRQYASVPANTGLGRIGDSVDSLENREDPMKEDK